jgi:hypothetical protein
MPPKVYLETTIPSYLASRTSRDLITAGHQQITNDWWEKDRAKFELYISQFVIDECRCGDTEMARKRLSLLENLTVLDIPDGATQLAKRLIEGGPLPSKAETDALHIAIAAANAMDYLVTWNMTHIANAAMERAIYQKCREAGFDPPVICTPEELLGENYYVEG